MRNNTEECKKIHGIENCNECKLTGEECIKYTLEHYTSDDFKKKVMQKEKK